MTQNWTNRIAGVRMDLDGEFTDRIEASSLTSQQWSLVMTATTFEIENPETPENATLVANTDSLSSVAGEMHRMERDGFGTTHETSRDGSILRWLADKFGRDLRPDVDFDEAEQLADEYAQRLQEKLVEHDRWAEVCSAASE